ncbi:hypothetical protein BY458DRAFT_517675 [Sporodiniella umbellata]|nr:hypothetical protein BY458DRAFT_517675 [Sporodiniella umbellata]
MKSMRWKDALWVVDFDKTVTWQDTIGVLGGLGLARSKCDHSWRYFTDAYLKEAEQHQGPAYGDLQSYCDYLESYRPVELASIERVNQHGVFQGLSNAELWAHGQRLGPELVRPDAIRVLRGLDKLRVLSLNWSKDWIQGCLSPLDIPHPHILANTLVEGKIHPSLVTSRDKQNQLAAFNSSPVVYVGDSLGDLEPLMAADLALVIGNDLPLASTLHRYGIAHHPVQDWAEIQRLFL